MHILKLLLQKILFYYYFIYIYIITVYIITEHPTSNNNINVVKEARKLFNDVRSNLSHEETKRLRKKNL